LITAVHQRGFRVSAVSREDLADVIVTRIAIESEALRRSMALGNDEWEELFRDWCHRPLPSEGKGHTFESGRVRQI
jgi:GntR family carbon starvation induced transcriptional regulator